MTEENHNLLKKQGDDKREDTTSTTSNELYSLTTTIGNDYGPLEGSLARHSQRYQSNQLSEPSRSSKKTESSNGLVSRHRKGERKDRNSIALNNTSYSCKTRSLHRGNSEGQMTEMTKTNQDLSKAAQAHAALVTGNQSTMYTHSENRIQIELEDVGKESLDRIRKDLTRMGIELQKNAREQLRFVSEQEVPNITDLGIKTD